MRTTTLGQTGLTVTRTAFGALPIQRLSREDAVSLVRRAYEAGIRFFDTARAYSDSEEKLALALADVRSEIVIATKTPADTAEEFWDDLHTSLRTLKTDYADILQFHNPSFVPVPGGTDGLYDAALEAKRQGLIRHIGITQHSLDRAYEAVESGLYETLQYPFNHLATEREVALVELCAKKNVGFIAMKAMSGGLITDAAISFSYLAQFENVVPIWGMQRERELAQFIALDQNPPAFDEAMKARVEEDRKALAGAFCRSCGYCLPCPVGIPIHQANRMKQLLTRAPEKNWLSPEWQAEMEKVENCTKCGQCAKKCPYQLKPYETLPAQLAYYREALAKRGL